MSLLSKITLTAQGGDQVAREISKVKKAYEDTAKAAEQIRKSGGKVSPEQISGAALTGMAIGREMREFFEGRESKNAQDRDSAERRENANRSRGGVGGRRQLPGQGAESAAQAAEQGASQISGVHSDSARFFAGGSGRAGDYLKDKAREYQREKERRDTEKASTGTSTAGSGAESQKEVTEGISRSGTALPIAGVAFTIAAAALRTISTMAHAEYSRAAEIWGSGMAQRLGMGYQGMRAQRIGLQAEGISPGSIDAFYNAMGASGGSGIRPTVAQYRNGMRGGIDTNALRNAAYYGIDASIVGRAVGLQQQSGIGNGMPEWMLGPQKMQQGFMGRYISSISNAIEEGMRQGFKSSALESMGKGVSNTMDALMKKGATFTEAESTTQALMSANTSAGSMIGSGREAMDFMRMRDPNLSFKENLMRFKNPVSRMQFMARYNQRVSGGGEALWFQNMGMYGAQMAPGQIDTLTAATEDIAAGKTNMARRRFVPSLRGVEGAWQMGAMQSNLLAPLEAEAIRVMPLLNSGVQMIVGGVTSLEATVKDGINKISKLKRSTSSK